MRKRLLALAFVLSAATSFAQLAMTRSTFTGTYTPIALPAATLSTATGDDVAQSAIPIGFTFNYLGTNYTTIGVNTNGVASFDATMSASGTNNNLFAANAPNLSLAPWWDNLVSDTILYQLQGAPGSQTFTIQWTNSLSYFNTSTQLLNFQVILYEGTNVIEFSYGPFVSGVAAANESASIGIEGATGGAGDYLDAVTGSAFTSNGMLNAATQWPAHNFRFTPGAPAAIAAGTYTVGVSGNYYSLSEAIADLNHRGIAGPVTLSLLDANYDVTPANGDNFFPMLLGPVTGVSATDTILIAPVSGTATITSEGTQNGNCGNASANNVISNTNEPILSFVGVQYVRVQNLSLVCSNTGVVDRGLQVINSSATAGSQNNVFKNISVSLNRANTGCYGISQQAITNPSAASGSNSNNMYRDLTISNVYTGIYLNGNANFPDQGCSVGTSSPNFFNTIGAGSPGDIGGGTGNTATYGIRANNQNGVSIFNNEVRNLEHSGTTTVEGIVIDAGVGLCSVYMNKVHDVYYTGANSTQNISGIRVNLAAAGTNEGRVYNNFVYNIGSTYSGAATATRAVKGIVVQTAGGNNTSTINVDFNNVRLDNSASPNLSGTCFESGVVNGPAINVRNNVFANFTGAQTGNARHFAMATPNTTQVGNTGSVSDYNDLYINDTTNGFTGIGQTTTYNTLAAWQTAMTQDANSVVTDPGYFTTTDLHVSGVGLNGTGNMTGITWVSGDIDTQVRGGTPDIGADEFTPLLLDASANALVTPLTTGCHGNAEPVVVRIKNFASVPLDFTTDPVTVTVNVTGVLTQTLNFVINNNTLNGNAPLASGATLDVPVGTINMTANGTYTFDAFTTLGGDGNPVNDPIATVNINYTPGTANVSPTTVCAGSSVNLTLSGASAGGTIQWQSSTDGGNTWVNETGTGFDSTFYNVIPSGNTMYQVLFCGTLVSNTVSVTSLALTSPTAADDTICGPGNANLNASGSGTINWYAVPTGGVSLATGNTYSPNVSTTTTFYVTNTTGSVTQGVGLFDNSAGGGQSGSNNSIIFDVLANCTLNGVYVYPGAAGNVVVDLVDNGNNVLNSVTVAVGTSDINQRTYIPLGFSLTPGTGMTLVRNAASVQLWRNNVGVNYPYTLPGIIDITTSTAGNGFYYFFYDWQIGYGCESASVPVTVTVTAPPAIVLTASADSICGGSSSNLGVSSSNSNYTYTWSPAGSLNTSSGTNVTATPAATTTYTVNAGDVSSGCNAVDSITVVVNVLPVFTPVSTDPVVCNGTPDTLTVSNVQSVGLFDNSAGGNMSASANNLIFDVLSNCTLAGVYIYPAAAGNVIIELQDNTNAVINTMTYVATAADVNNRTYVALNFPLTPATGMQLVRNAASVQLWRNNVGVNYPYTLPGVLDITTSTAGNGFYYFFYNWQIVTPGPYTYSWSSVPSGFTATGDTAFIAPTVTTQYNVLVTDTITGCSATYSTTVYIAGAIIPFITGDTALCAGDSTILVAGYTLGDGTATYVWSGGLGTNDSISVAPASTTPYTVTVTDGCGSTGTVTATVTVSSVAPAAAFNFTVSGPNTFTFTDASTGAVTWAWDFGDSQTSTVQNPTNVYSTPGTYTVTLIVSNGCGSDTITQVILADGIAEANTASGISVYPNPVAAAGQLNILFKTNSSTATLRMLTLQGKVLVNQQLNNVQAGTTVPVNVSGFAAGLYMLQVQTERGVEVIKVQVK